MKQLLILALTMSAMACVAEPAAKAPPMTQDESELSNTSTADPEAATPRFLDCDGDPCLLWQDCVDQGEPYGKCKQTGVCCRL